MAFVIRKLRATISLASIQGQPQSFPGTGGADTVVVTNLRMSADVQHAGGPSDGTLNLTIYGLQFSTINRLSTLGMQINLVPRNTITLEAGQDDGQGNFTNGSVVFTGYILSAYGDFNAQPEVSFHITAHTLAPYATAPVKATSFKGSTDVAIIMSGFATLMACKFENNGVQTQLQNPYFSGSARQQAQACVKAAGINWNHGDLGILAIWPKNGSRGGSIPVVSPTSGMKGYPSYTAYGISVETVFNPSIGFGGKIQVNSSLQPATGQWVVYGLNHFLESDMPGGAWFSTVLGYNPKYPTPIGN